MSSLLLPIHLTFVGIWLGCVITEALFERALLGKGKEQELILVALHKKVDLFVEIPAFVVVLVTGMLMLPFANASGLFNTKVMFGLLAIFTNIYCVWLVFRRSTAANNGESEEFSRLDHKQHKFGAIVLFSIIAALLIGLYTHTAG